MKHKCPKCDGEGTINAYSHRNNGVCYDCHGTGFVVEKQPPPVHRNKNFKKISLPTFGDVLISKDGKDGFKANFSVGGTAWFDVKNARISNLQVSDFFSAMYAKKMQAELQQALRA